MMLRGEGDASAQGCCHQMPCTQQQGHCADQPGPVPALLEACGEMLFLHSCVPPRATA